uniref:Uncharacterized protein n=1 Tax=Oryza meridionalis TaxID=40149 RepID=A0A0E0EWU3_9ORYZ
MSGSQLQGDMDGVLRGCVQGAPAIHRACHTIGHDGLSYELLVLLSGLLPNPKLETSMLSICLNTGSLMFMVPFGLCTAIRAYHHLHDDFATQLWGYMYNNEAEVVKYIARMIPVLATSFFMIFTANREHRSVTLFENTISSEFYQHLFKKLRNPQMKSKSLYYRHINQVQMSNGTNIVKSSISKPCDLTCGHNTEKANQSTATCM